MVSNSPKKNYVVKYGQRVQLNEKPTNEILEMINIELKLDHFYVEQHKLILVKVDGETINNPVLSEW